jgi:hypothetical protein
MRSWVMGRFAVESEAAKMPGLPRYGHSTWRRANSSMNLLILRCAIVRWNPSYTSSETVIVNFLSYTYIYVPQITATGIQTAAVSSSPRGARVNRKRVDAARKLVGKHLVHHAVALDPALPFERRRYNMDPVMGFAAGPVACVSGMQVRLIGDVEMRRGKCPGQLFDQSILPRHAARLAVEMRLLNAQPFGLLPLESGCQVLHSGLGPSHNDRS